MLRYFYGDAGNGHTYNGTDEMRETTDALTEAIKGLNELELWMNGRNTQYRLYTTETLPLYQERRKMYLELIDKLLAASQPSEGE